MVDYRHLAIDTLTDFAEEHRDMSFGDILYSCVRNSSTGLDIPTEEIKKLRSIPDEEWYKIIEKAKKNEREEY
jgi:hypothetical protein